MRCVRALEELALRCAELVSVCAACAIPPGVVTSFPCQLLINLVSLFTSSSPSLTHPTPPTLHTADLPAAEAWRQASHPQAAQGADWQGPQQGHTRTRITGDGACPVAES